jgi:hypothetical protein
MTLEISGHDRRRSATAHEGRCTTTARDSGNTFKFKGFPPEGQTLVALGSPTNDFLNFLDIFYPPFLAI